MKSRHRRTAAGQCLLARTAAVVATGCAVLHLVDGAPAALWTAVALACLPCAVHLWLRPRRVAWATHVALCLAMGAHPVVAAALPAAGCPHGDSPAGGSRAGARPGGRVDGVPLTAGRSRPPRGVALVARP